MLDSNPCHMTMGGARTSHASSIILRKNSFLYFYKGFTFEKIAQYWFMVLYLITWHGAKLDLICIRLLWQVVTISNMNKIQLFKCEKSQKYTEVMKK